MYKLLLVIIGIGIAVASTPQLSHAALSADKRYTNCDACGLCITPAPNDVENPPPPTMNNFPNAGAQQAWQTCARCLYPDQCGANPDHQSGCSLEIPTVDLSDPSARPNTGASTKEGNFYTAFGCISLGGSARNNSGAAAPFVNQILSFIFAITGALTFIFIVYGSFLILTSSGSPERLRVGQKTLLGALLGGGFVMMSVFIINLVANNILKLPGFGN